MTPTNIAVLVSGGGTNLQALIDAEKSGIIKSGKISLVISSKPGVFALERAEKAGIRTAVCERKAFADKKAFDDALLKLLEENNTELIVLAGFMCILGKEFTDKYPERIINIHPSLIRCQGYGCNGAFRKRDTRRWQNYNAEGCLHRRRRYCGNSPEESYGTGRMGNNAACL